MKFQVRAAEDDWYTKFLSSGLLETPGFKLVSRPHVHKLDQNEMSVDWPQSIKRRVADELLEASWNHYPVPYDHCLRSSIADSIGVDGSNIVVGPGSNYQLSVLLSVFGRGLQGKLLLAAPSFPLFEAHCRYDGIAYERWSLDQNFEYDISLLKDLPEYSAVIFATPNNPTGTELPLDKLRQLLIDHPQSMFVADEAYGGFTDQNLLPLLAEFSNLILVRTLSKSSASAGIRLSYIVAAAPLAEELHKVTLPFIVNHFSAIACRYIFGDAALQKFLAKNTAQIVAERERIYLELLKVPAVKVIPSKANFFLLKWASNELAERGFSALLNAGLLTRKVYNGDALKGCVRVTIGSKKANDRCIHLLREMRASLESL